LNKGDFFLVKLLLDGVLEPMELKFEITAEDLPPIIKPKLLPSALLTSKEPRIDWPAIVVGMLLLVISFASGFSTYIMYQAQQELSSLFPFSHGTSSTLAFAIFMLCLFGSVLLFGAALAFIVGIGLEGVKRQRFPLPANLNYSPFTILWRIPRNRKAKDAKDAE
jgi:hypothetical protein